MADILIRGMAMPKSCEDCRLSYTDQYGVTICAACDDCAYSVSCPLVPLPEGHGRLIDADALLLDSGEICEVWGDGFATFGFSREQIENALTIVPAEGGTDNGF